MSKAKTAATVLVADDDPEILSLVSIRLKKKGYTVLEIGRAHV